MMHLKNEPIECFICDLKLDTGHQLRSHLSTHSDYKKCPNCGQEFSRVYGFIQHKNKSACGKEHPFTRLHVGEKIFCKCIICDKHFDNMQIYNSHLSKHADFKQCPDCKEDFGRVIDYIKHKQDSLCKKNGEVPMRKMYCCALCKQAHTSITALQNHVMSIHNKAEDFITETVKKTLSNKAENETEVAVDVPDLVDIGKLIDPLEHSTGSEFNFVSTNKVIKIENGKIEYS